MMPYILNIHTATEIAIVNLSLGARTIFTARNINTKQHAAFVHEAVNDVLTSEGITAKDLNAIGVTSGPGSYTGMRVGLAAAKGFCYALQIPLIAHNTLELIALSTIDFAEDREALYCPMIDARRMEVYSAIYDFNMKQVEPPGAKILNEDSFRDYLEKFKIIFSGSGSKKFQQLVKTPASRFVEIDISTEVLTKASREKYKKSDFEDVSTIYPLYMKDFYTTSRKLHS